MKDEKLSKMIYEVRDLYQFEFQSEAIFREFING